jgi:diguanylate cyclase (GGDEF)-like protein
MLRNRVDADARPAPVRRAGRVAPVPLRVALIAVIAALMVAAVGGPAGFWVALPAVLVAASFATSGLGAFACAVALVVAECAVISVLPGDSLPPLWLVVVVPGGCVTILHRTVRRLRRERDAMEQAAYTDPLTGLANRRLLRSVAEHEIARHLRSGERFSVVMLDLDGFKLLNDRYGHAAGDEMLCDVATRLKQALRAQDTVARLGGDEFCVIAPATGDPRPLAEKIRHAVSHAARGYEELRASLGIAVFPDDGNTIELLLRTSDDRLLSAKRRLHGTRQRRAA